MGDWLAYADWERAMFGFGVVITTWQMKQTQWCYDAMLVEFTVGKLLSCGEQ